MNKPGGKRAHVIVVGNEKGGSGKSTTAMHVIVGLLKRGRSVVSIDVDFSQQTLSRYITNRDRFIATTGNDIRMPVHYSLDSDAGPSVPEADPEQLRYLIEGASVGHDAVVVDSPGTDSTLSRLAHSYADTLITPINDSLVDLDVLAQFDGSSMSFLGPGNYSKMVREQKKARAARDGGRIDWMVIRNRIGSLDTRCAREVYHQINNLAKQIGFRVVPGLSERVIFRELFMAGLTILDLKDAVGPMALSQSHHAAREEVQTIINAIGLTQLVAA
jgi:chromosome partitioning protein